MPFQGLLQDRLVLASLKGRSSPSSASLSPCNSPLQGCWSAFKDQRTRRKRGLHATTQGLLIIGKSDHSHEALYFHDKMQYNAANFQEEPAPTTCELETVVSVEIAARINNLVTTRCHC